VIAGGIEIMRTYSNSIGNRIRQLRSDIPLSQEQLALKAGIAPSFIGEIERNEKKPSIETLEKIANALEVSLSELFNYNVDTLVNSDNFYLDKILMEVRNYTNVEQEALYRLLKQAIAFKNIKE
jgi:transcriptional regulator with XRE-family HTH domain